ncbi:MAG: AraC family transcriptional regulator [Paenibacillus sp.]|nr:AraC family transcriptional regulator [Paenibacillus sp.]
MNASLDFFHVLTRDADSYIPFHSHSGFELVYYASGTGTTHIDQQKYAYSAGQFALIQPGCPHDEYRRTSTDVLFLGFFWDNASIPLRNGLYSDSPNGTIGKLLERMASELANKARFYEFLLRGLLMEVVVEIGRIADIPEPAEDSHDNLVYAKNYIEQYHGEKVNLQSLAKTLGYSYDYFRHQFKDYTGYSPMQYTVHKRLEKAKQMLVHDTKSITEVSIECGFSNTPQFCKMFKKQFGVSPKIYRDHRTGKT